MESLAPSEVLVVGSGAAGLTTALLLAERRKVTVLSKVDVRSGSTPWAQGESLRYLTTTTLKPATFRTRLQPELAYATNRWCGIPSCKVTGPSGSLLIGV